MRSRVCETVGRPSVCLFRHSLVARRRSGFAAERFAGRRYRISIISGGHELSSSGAAARRTAANANSVTFTAGVGG